MQNIGLVKALFIAAASAAFCFSFSSLFYYYPELEYSSLIDHLENFQLPSFSQSLQESDTSLGRRIVEKAFNDSYADLVEVCGVLDEKDSLNKCLGKLYKDGLDPTSVNSKKWPWWFHTMVRDAKKPATGLFGGWHFLQFPDPLMQVCVYEKGGTKMWRRLHCDVLSRTVNTTGDTLPTGVSDTLTNCFYRQGPLATDNVERSVFLRDPLERFLSGFLDKCASPSRVAQTHCQPNVIFRSNQTDHIKDHLKNTQKLFEIHVDTSPLKWDLHFLPLSFHCDGLFDRIKEYDFVGMMNKNFYQELGRFTEHYPSIEYDVRKTFKIDGKENATNYGTEQQAALHTWDYYTPNTIRRVLQYASIDYMLLNLSIPEWAEEILKKDDTFLV